MGYFNVVRAVVGLPPKIVSKCKDSDGFTWTRDREGFYFRSERVGVKDAEEENSVTIYTWREPIRAAIVPADVKKALESEGAGFDDQSLAQDLAERWSYRRTVKA